MIILDGALVRDQNWNDVDDSCFDTSELEHMQICLRNTLHTLDLGQFVVDGKLQRHPQTKFPNDISTDQAHMYSLATGNKLVGLYDPYSLWPKTTNKDPVSIGFFANIRGMKWLTWLSLLGQIILFWIPVRWCDGNNPTVSLGPIKLNLGFRHHCGDYRLFKQSLSLAPWIIRRLVRKSTLKQMTRWYWEPEPNVDWLIAIDDKFVDECL